MKKMKMTVTVCLAALMAVGMTACTNGGGTGGGGSGTGSTTVRIYTWTGNELDSVSADSVFKKVEEKTGVKVAFEGAGLEDYYTQLSPMVNSGDVPDLMWVDPQNSDGNFYTWADPKQEMLYGLDELLLPNAERYPYLNKLVYSDQYKNIMYYDDHYIIPVVETKSAWAIYYRADWLIQIGYTNEDGTARVPETLAEFEDVMKKFSGDGLFTDDNGKKSGRTYGLSPNMQAHYLNPLYGAFGITPDWDIDEEGNVSYMFAREEFKNYLDWMNAMFKAGWIDPTYNTNNGETDRDDFKSGTAGCIMTNGESHMEWVIGGFEDMQGKDKIVVGPPPVGTGEISELTGKKLGVAGERGYSDWGGDYGGYCISRDTKDVYKVLDLLEYLISPEGSILRLYGIEGQHYYLDEEGKIVADIDGRSSDRGSLFDTVTNTDKTSAPGGLHKMGNRFGYSVDWDYFEETGEFRIGDDLASLHPRYSALMEQALGWASTYLQHSNLTNVTAWPSSVDAKMAECEKLAWDFVNKAIMGTKNLTSGWADLMKDLDGAGYAKVKDSIRETAYTLGII